jgi:hypothetical protein
LYLNGNDCIGEHADKTLDIAKGSTIFNVSFGASRHMYLRLKKVGIGLSTSSTNEMAGIIDSAMKTAVLSQTTIISRDKDDDRSNKIRLELPHNSVLALDWEANRYYLHGINADKRSEKEKSLAETNFHGERISLTFRRVATFLRLDGVIVGQGAPSVNNNTIITTNCSSLNSCNEEQVDDRIQMYTAFAAENMLQGFNWDSYYSSGFHSIL